MKRLLEIAADMGKILKKRHLSSRQRFSLLACYLGINAKRFLSRFGIIDVSKQKIFGNLLYIENYQDFFWTFKEVFIDEDYYFPTKKEKPAIIDCGGNIGVTVSYFKFIYPKAIITVFEPISSNLVLLRKNIVPFENVMLIEKAVGREKGKITIFGDRRAATIAKDLIEEQNKKSNDYKGKEETIEIDTVSSYVKEEVDFLKLDIEGAEGDVLEDLENNGKLRSVSQMGMEYHHFSFEKNKLSRILELMERNKFDVVFFGDFINLGKMPKRKYYNFMLYGKQRTNV